MKTHADVRQWRLAALRCRVRRCMLDSIGLAGTGSAGVIKESQSWHAVHVYEKGWQATDILMEALEMGYGRLE